MSIHLKGECCENFPKYPKWTRMNAQIDKRTYLGNIGLTKIEGMNGFFSLNNNPIKGSTQIHSTNLVTVFSSPAALMRSMISLQSKASLPSSLSKASLR